MCLCLASILGGVAFAGSPQICLKPETKYPILLEHSQNNDIAWFDLRNVLQDSAAENFIFFGQENHEDVTQIELVRQFTNVHVIPFKTDLHGVVFYPFCAQWFLKNAHKLRNISSKQKPQTRFCFSVHVAGFCNTLANITITVMKKIKS